MLKNEAICVNVIVDAPKVTGRFWCVYYAQGRERKMYHGTFQYAYFI